MSATTSTRRKNTAAPPADPAPGAGAAPRRGASPGRGGRPRGGSARSVRPEGLVIERWWTKAGVDPFDTVEWELRTAAITGERGEVIFEQRDVEVPRFWSQLATNVVTSKYFRGPMGDPSRERSVRQLIGRVVRTIVGWGREGGYFATETDADAFRDELTHLLLHQKASFNSPVWFNLGVPGARPQASACFINSVEDTMESIMQLAATEALLFKGGSGTGTNLSPIRSSREPLAGGGIASGPLSFMRGYDAFAGAIKSGGKTRRAAKMVILDVSHPDVVDFIRSKAEEEKKAWALIEAGYDGGFNVAGGAYDSIFFQNANHSVRVTDEFMHAVVAGSDWRTRFVLTGEVAETYKARDLLHKIADATHICGDPGMQFDTTINRWHTCKQTDRIYASNPCSEFMFLNDTACNLASLNLMKFRTDEGEFDAAAFAHACEVMITAQEIIVDRASYPTEKIAQNSYDYRPLGLGYANLGALLMSWGFPYDSDAGRAIAGAITALMTGAAYRQSARIASFLGPFAGYERNRESMLEVIALHRGAVDGIDARLVEPQLLDAARGAWDDSLALGRQHGFRNSQCSVLAPTGTIAFMMDCDTTGIEPDIALVKYKTLVGGGVMKIVNQTVPEALRRLGYRAKEVSAIVDAIDANGTIEGAPFLREEDLPVFDCAFRAASGTRSIHYMGHLRMMAAVQPFISGAISKCVTGETLLSTDEGLIRIGTLHRGEVPDTFRPETIRLASTSGNAVTDAFYYGGFRPTLEVTLRSGHQITGTPNHRLLTLRDGRLDWIRLDEINAESYVGLRYGAGLWAGEPASLSSFKAQPPHHAQKRIRIPDQMSAALAFFLGVYAAEGHTNRSNWTVTITHGMAEILEEVGRIASDLFGLEGRVVVDPGKCPGLCLTSKTLVEFLSYLGVGERASEKRIPDAILRSPKEVVLAYLSGLYFDGYLATTTSGTPKVGICLASDGLLDDLQAVLTNLGFLHGRVRKWNSKYERHYGEVYLSGRQAIRFAEVIRWVEPHKIERAAEWAQLQVGASWSDVVPGVSGRYLYSLLPHGGRGKPEVRSHFTYLLDPRTRNVSWDSLREVSEVPGVELPEDLLRIIRENIHFVPVREVRSGGVREVFDVSVPETHAFVGNGIVNHNTCNVPEDISVEEIEQVYVDAWKLGLKAVAIYRDGSKRTQPLATSLGDSARPAAGEARPLRRKLPDERRSITHKFSIAGHEGYVTVGMYEDGSPGEIFIVMSKEGSVVSGLMDSFATAISLALQYGVPLRVLVNKFSHTRFEPAGWTNNKEIPIAKSVTDYIFRWLALKFIPQDEAATAEVAPGLINGHANGHTNGESGGALPIPAYLSQEDAPPCTDCGAIMVRNGSCYRCLNCGSTSGCS
jgi:adenosylcobalamin-dependent ribonucleoside-diphosphate reductase